MSWIKSQRFLGSSLTVVMLLTVLIVVSSPLIGSFVTSAAVYSALAILLFVLLHEGNDDPIVGRILVSQFDQEPEPGSFRYNPYLDTSGNVNLTEEEKRELLQEYVKEAADQSVPVGLFTIVSICILIAVVYNKIHSLPPQLYGLLLSGSGGLLLAIDRPRTFGAFPLDPEYQTKQILQGFWGALLLALGFLLQLVAVFSAPPA